jgi:phytoene dehydrogenase-like protein
VRYDAAIIGASADGLAAAAMLARGGLRTIVIERSDLPSGLLCSREFHPGFRASPYLDEIAPIPASIHWDLDLTRRGAVFVPAPCSLARWPDRDHVLNPSAVSPASSLLHKATALRAQTIRRAEKEHKRRRYGWLSFPRTPPREPWPGEVWGSRSLAELLQTELNHPDAAAHHAALALCGRTADPSLLGTALQVLVPGAGLSGIVSGGFERLATALANAARDAGAEIRYGIDVSELKIDNGRVAYVALSDGTEIEAKAIVSTLDLKRTFLSLFSWKTLPKPLVSRTGTFRMAGSTARVLFALKAAPGFSVPDLLRGPIHVAPSLSSFAAANAAWRSATIAGELPTSLRLVTALDPGLAPPGCAVITATLGAVPFRLFDGGWTKEKRDLLRDLAIAAAEFVFPGFASLVIASDVITPADMDDALGATDGDLWGGEFAADQMFDLRPWADPPPPRTTVRGLYLAGLSSPLGPIATCAAGIHAAKAVLADLRINR